MKDSGDEFAGGVKPGLVVLRSSPPLDDGLVLAELRCDGACSINDPYFSNPGKLWGSGGASRKVGSDERIPDLSGAVLTINCCETRCG